MNTTITNAQRMVNLFEQMRHAAPTPAFNQLRQLNLSFSHMRMLRLLAHQGTLSMKDLAEQLQITPPSVTALTRRLVQVNFVQRNMHPDDSRVALLSLTEVGQAFHQQLGQEHVDQMARLLQGLSEGEQEQFLDLLERAIRAMRDSDDKVYEAKPTLNDEQEATPRVAVKQSPVEQL